MGLSEEDAAELVRFGCLWLNRAQMADPEERLPGSGFFRLNFPAYGPQKFYEASPGRVAYEDGEVLVYNKESGRPSLPVPYDSHNNAQAALIRLFGRPLWLIHRLDMGTSGLLLFAKTRRAAGFLGKSFARGAVKKRYLALSAGPPPEWRERDVSAPIAKVQNRFTVRVNGPGLSARTRFRVLAAKGGLVLFLAIPYTGRTHQIRLHLSLLEYPVIGDPFYGGGPGERLMLRASGLSFGHPSGQRRIVLGGPWEEADEEPEGA
jgi:RluA family pseudouridine synthase